MKKVHEYHNIILLISYLLGGRGVTRETACSVRELLVGNLSQIYVKITKYPLNDRGSRATRYRKKKKRVGVLSFIRRKIVEAVQQDIAQNTGTYEYHRSIKLVSVERSREQCNKKYNKKYIMQKSGKIA